MKELTYYVTKDDITPRDITEIGFVGESRATRIIFELSDELLDADDYLLNIVNGGGEFFSTDSLILSENKIIYDLPDFATAISGNVKLQLVIKTDGRVLFAFPCELRVLSLGMSDISKTHYLSGISDALAICKSAAERAEETMNAVKDNSALFVETVGDIETALEEIAFIQESYIGGNE